MNASANSRTDASLLGRLREDPSDQVAWNTFVQRYGPKIYGWCRHWSLQPADAQDVTQDVLYLLAKRLRSFAYDPARSFRAWLKTVTHHAWQDFLTARKRADAGSAVVRWLQGQAASDDLERRLAEEFDREILAEAMARVRLRVEPHTWEAFCLLALEGMSGAEAAPQVGMQVAMTYVAKSKVVQMLREEIRKLEGPEEDQ